MRRAPAIVLAALLILPIGCSRPQGDEESFCELAPGVDDLFALLDGFETADPAELDRRFDSGLEQYRALERSAPREIKHDVSVLVDLVEEVLDAVKENRGDRAAIAEDLGNLQQKYPGAASSGMKVVGFVRDECDLDLQSDPAGADGEPSTSVPGDGTTVPDGPTSSGGEPSTSTTGG